MLPHLLVKLGPVRLEPVRVEPVFYTAHTQMHKNIIIYNESSVL